MLLSLSHPSLYPSSKPTNPPSPQPSPKPSLHYKTPKPPKRLRSAPGPDPDPDPDQTLARKSAIQTIADKLRSLGFLESDPTTTTTPAGPGTAGEIFIPTPHELPNRRVGYTIDSSWSSPENPIPVPGSGPAIARLHELWRAEERKEKKPRAARVPTVAELTIPAEELKRLREVGIGLDKKLKVEKAGITEGIVNGIHERLRRSELVKIKCEDLCRMNMKRTHEVLERKTGGLVV